MACPKKFQLICAGDMQYFKNKCFGWVPGDALVATHPFSPMPMFVCHGCQSMPALYSFPAYFTVPQCPLFDGTWCPWCYYPRTLPGRAGGRFPPIIVISDVQPGEGDSEGERSREKEEADTLSPCFSFTLWFCLWQRAAKVSRLYFLLHVFLCVKSKSRDQLSDSDMHKQEIINNIK